MNKEFYDIVMKIFSSKSLSEAGRKIVDFTLLALKEKNCKHITEEFYRFAYFYIQEYDNYLDDIIIKEKANKKYKILHQQNDNVIGWYIITFIPKMTTPKKTLKSIQEFGVELTNNFHIGNNEILSVEEADKIMSVLNKEYKFSDVVFNDRKLIVSIMNETKNNVIEDGELLTIKNLRTGLLKFYIFLYPLNKKESDNCGYVFIHELAHALHSKFCNTPGFIVPENIQKILSELCFPGFETMPIEEQSEIFADVLSMGMMYHTELECYDPFIKIKKSDKQKFQEIFLSMIEAIKESNAIIVSTY